MKLKKFNIYKIFVMLLLVSATLFYACDEKTEVNPKAELEFIEVTIPNAYKSATNDKSSSNEVDDVTMDVEITTIEGKEIEGKIHLVMPDNESLSYFAMTENIFAETGLTPDYWVEALSANTNGRLLKPQGCFGNCTAKFGKGGKKNGKGACKANCWLDIAVKVATIIKAIK